LGPFSIDEELRLGRLQAAKVVGPELKRYVTLAQPKQGHLTQASRIVSRLIKETVEGWNGRLNIPNEVSALQVADHKQLNDAPPNRQTLPPG
jgi:LysR family transcriptional regulator, nitrogen assimilation regulatory protein